MRSSLRFALTLSLTAALAACGSVDGGTASSEAEQIASSEAEAKTAAALEALRDDEAGLTAFLAEMPKGADVHTHLSGAVFAESYIAWAREAGFCFHRETMALVRASQCKAPTSAPMPASDADPTYQALVRAWSMEGFDEAGPVSGHDHFFATFARFFLISVAKPGEMLAEATERAERDRVRYLEPMISMTTHVASKLAAEVWKDEGTLTVERMDELRERLLAHPTWSEGVVTAARRELDAMEAKRRELQRCDGADAAKACAVEVRYVAQATRTKAPHELFAQVLAAFEIAKVDARVVGVNLSAPEDHPTALADYDLHMAAIGHLVERADREKERRPRVALHAGELRDAFMPEGQTVKLRDHMRKAVTVAHAERIGHGISIHEESQSTELLGELAQRGVLLEACLSSNDQILEVSGDAHPLPAYLAAGVPVALATDDQGVSRSSMTHEHLRAVRELSLDYRTLKAMARQSLERSFVEGESLYADAKSGVLAAPCDGARAAIDGGAIGEACAAKLAASPKARLERDLEASLRAFESAHAQ